MLAASVRFVSTAYIVSIIPRNAQWIDESFARRIGDAAALWRNCSIKDTGYDDSAECASSRCVVDVCAGVVSRPLTNNLIGSGGGGGVLCDDDVLVVVNRLWGQVSMRSHSA